MHISSSILVGNQSIPYREIHERFSQTPAGKTLGSNVRFSWFKPPSMRNEEWVRLLGMDVCNLEHLWVSVGMTRMFIQRSLRDGMSIEPATQEELLLTAVSHDWAESKHADKKGDMKTDADHTEEMDTLMGESIDWVHQWIPDLATRVRTSIDRTLQDKQSPQAKMFESVEKLGYLRTGLLAYKQSLKHANQEELASRLQILTADVFGNQLSALTQKAQYHPAVAFFLAQHQPVINHVITFISSPSVFALHQHRIPHAPNPEERFAQAKEAWELYSGTSDMTIFTSSDTFAPRLSHSRDPAMI